MIEVSRVDQLMMLIGDASQGWLDPEMAMQIAEGIAPYVTLNSELPWDPNA